MRLALVLCLFAAPAFAEVTASGPGGFTVEHEVTVSASRAEVFAAAVDQVGEWWNSDHTVGLDASRMRIDARPMGCFCEDLGDDNGVVHLVVTFVNRDVILRLTGGLGPLGLMGVNGNMTWEFFDADAGGTRVKWSYAVGGFRQGGLNALALPVDAVIGEALARMAAFVETGDAANATVSEPGE